MKSKLLAFGVAGAAVVAVVVVAFAVGPEHDSHAAVPSTARSDDGSQTLQQAVALSTRLGPLSATAKVQIVLSLRSKREQTLERLFSNGQGATGSKGSALIAPSTELVRKALATARAAGFVTAWAPGDAIASLAGNPKSVQRLFGVRLSRYAEPGGGIFFAGDRAPKLPSSLEPVVTGVAGLDDFVQLSPAEVTPGGATPPDMLKFYDVAPLRAAGLDGSGETVVLPEAINPALFATLRSDLARYSTEHGLPPADISLRAENRWAPFVSGKDTALTEADLDVDVVHAIAPKAKLIIYPFGAGNGFIPAEDAAVTENPTGILSLSYGGCEQAYISSPAFLKAAEQPWLDVAGENLSAFGSTGDEGAYRCGQSKGPWIEFPSDTPVLVAVGGTVVFLGKNGSYGFEMAWGEALTEWGGGGGVSKLFARPPFQKGAGYPGTKSAPGRLVPDVAANAHLGWSIVSGGKDEEVGGTSAAAPFWAGLTALIDQDLVRNHLRRVGVPLGAFAAIASKHDGAFHDVTAGNNLFYNAGTGWDAATGLGSPDAAILDRDIKAYIKAGGK